MTSSVIVAGPAGCGKTRNAEKIAAWLGLKLVYDSWDGGPFPAFDTLVLTNRADVPNARSYASVMAEIEAAEHSARITTHRQEV